MPQDGTLLRERSSNDVYLMDQEAPRVVYRAPDTNDDVLHFVDRTPVIKDDVLHFDYRAPVINDINDINDAAGSGDRDRFPVIVVPDGSLAALVDKGNR
jgi:hypothetical protein